MRHLLQRHPFPMRTRFAHSLVLTYALPPEVLTALVPPGLSLDTYTDQYGHEHGFVAAAVVDARALRPSFLPAACGGDHVLTGYRIFTRFPTPTGRTMRGLRILRSDTDDRLMALGGNVFSRYNYHRARITTGVSDGDLHFDVRSDDGHADLVVRARIGDGSPARLPEGSPFATARDARRFAGPLPYTFEYEPQTDSVIVVKATRTAWDPVPVDVEVSALTFFDHGSFAGARPRLANAFHVADVDYGWEAGRRRTREGAAA
ncbi:DUF2071 domain-containing protein [Streptacidiphilus jiangxiensis]|uniref:Uncharacterized conserved protein (COG2071) n=1 Tax=Streptacidiphilus jiangxiensis TaxID=235985 RepID=A0A1H7WZY0_STRJI|nr:DUF2071 domain-containing protein [Streptacidiphilus jiangxiensis]SEM26865.1 Uncharacterized conserved protein (COG2071) [Streptacidiphilus jiangxiensis]